MKAVQGSLAENARLILDVEKILTATIPDWKLFMQFQSNQSIPIEELKASFKLSTNQIDNANPTESSKNKVEEAASDPEVLINLYKDLVLEQKALRSEYMQEIASVAQEDEQAARRKEDHTPIVCMAIKALAEVGVLKDIVRDLRGG
jgi:ubiquitin carboxyl-terminal hydrolase L5